MRIESSVSPSMESPQSIEFFESFRKLVRHEIAAVKAELLREIKTPTRPNKTMLSIHDIQKTYGIGRREIRDLINSGKLPAEIKRCRGGKNGHFVHVKDAERVFIERE